jgi:hypothetical protein
MNITAEKWGVKRVKTENWQQITSAYVPRTLAADLKQCGKLPLDECIALGLSMTTALRH